MNKIIKYKIQSLLIRIEKRAIISWSKSPRKAFLYYLIWNKSFLRECHAVLAGKNKHIRDSRVSKDNYFMLVRNVHRIEKGLLMRPRRAVFGKDYLGETIDCFEGVWQSDKIRDYDNMQMKWFHDVLLEYFTSAGSEDSFINSQRLRFNQCLENVSLPEVFASANSHAKSIPYFRLEENKSKIAYDEFYKLCVQRRSVRWFLDKPVSRALIDKAILAGNQSPSACNRQPFEYRIFDEKDLVKEGVSLPWGTAGYGHTIPVFIVLVGNLDAYFDERDRHIIYIDASLAAMSFMLALETIGISSCAINWPDIEEKEKQMEKFLNLKNHQRAIMCMGIGYADPEGKVAFSEKRPLAQIRKYNN